MRSLMLLFILLTTVYAYLEGFSNVQNHFYETQVIRRKRQFCYKPGFNMFTSINCAPYDYYFWGAYRPRM
uniref:Uncharacterized protein n=1 Tax=Steinernema glaseri TaxID=37863 RepID=A0A1I7Y6F6_9BILA